MLVCGDVNGDGHEDVATVNSFNNNAAILLGAGDGQLGDADVHATDPFPLATDLGDLNRQLARRHQDKRLDGLE